VLSRNAQVLQSFPGVARTKAETSENRTGLLLELRGPIIFAGFAQLLNFRPQVLQPLAHFGGNFGTLALRALRPSPAT
jgi:hypothetical protein